MQRAGRTHRHRGARGFAVIEWLLALAIASSIVAAAVGPWRRWWVGLALSRTEQAMLTSLAIARHAVLRHNRPVDVCRADADGNCASTVLKDAAGRTVTAADWPYGWLVVVDLPSRDAGASIRRQGSASTGETGRDASVILHRVAAINGVRVSSTIRSGRLRFRPPLGLAVGRWGQMRIAPDVAPDDRAVVRDGPLAVRCVVVGGAGRARVVRGDCR